MKRTHSKAALIRKRVKTIQGRAKFAGILYLLGALALAAAVVCLPLLNGTSLGEDNKLLPILSFYQPILELFDGGIGNILNNIKALDANGVADLASAVFYACLVLGVVINALRCFGKLGWLFKRRASYANGFNRNMYAMDDLAKRYSGSLAAIVNFYLIIYVLTAGTPAISTFGYIALGGGLVLHFIAGLIGGTVTLFTTGDELEEEEREYGLFTFLVRNIIQLAAIAAILYFLIPNSVVATEFTGIIVKVIGGDFGALVNIPVIVELVAWLCLFVLVKHATAATEFNRDCTDGAGMKNFAVFSLFTAIAIAAIVVLPMVGIGEGELNKDLIITAAIAFVAFLLDCIIRPRSHSRRIKSSDELGVEEYFMNAEASKYNNTIV